MRFQSKRMLHLFCNMRMSFKGLERFDFHLCIHNDMIHIYACIRIYVKTIMDRSCSQT